VLTLAWVLRLRWVAIAGQVAAIGAVHGLMGIALPLAPLGAILAFAAATNVAVALWSRRHERVHEAVVAALVAAEIASFTGLLFFSGGPANPFSFLYLVYIALATLALHPAWTWSLAGLAVACFGLLFAWHVPLEAVSHAAHGAGSPPDAGDHAHHAHASERAPAAARGGSPMELHLYGMWVAFGVGAAAIVYFLDRVTRALADRDEELRAARDRAARTEKLASLATLSAGAAHELATPLATIAVVAHELERSLQGDPDCAREARLVREQVERCRHILHGMAAGAGEPAGERIEPATVTAVIEAAIAGLGEDVRPRVRVERSGTEATVRVPLDALTRAVRGLVANALDASGPSDEVVVRTVGSSRECRIEVSDHGEGMAPEVRRRAGEPFFTTKEPGQGMGLGLFLARVLAERIGGDLQIESDLGRGTTVSMVLPAREPA
jgi:two-component system sensor histidine kinase RegB